MRLRRWAVVQDLRPFGIRIEGRSFTKAGAKLRAAGSYYLMAMKVEDVEAENERLFATPLFDLFPPKQHN